MLKPLVRYTLVALLWRFYKRTIVSAVIVIAGFVLISMLHTDFLAYTNSQPIAKHVGLSFVVKWIAYVALILWFIWGLKRDYSNSKQHQQSLKDTMERSAKVEQRHQADPSADPFRNIRNKEKLRSRAELVIEKHK